MYYIIYIALFEVISFMIGAAVFSYLTTHTHVRTHTHTHTHSYIYIYIFANLISTSIQGTRKKQKNPVKNKR